MSNLNKELAKSTKEENSEQWEDENVEEEDNESSSWKVLLIRDNCFN